MEKNSMSNKIIKDGHIINNDWLLIETLENNQFLEKELPEKNLFVSLDIWQSHKNILQKKNNLGLYLKNDQCIGTIADELEYFNVIAIDFPVFMDGRGFSIARILRDRYDYQGELRACGAIIRDQLCYLKRCGFNSFDMAEDIDLEASLTSLNDFSESYQTAADQASPLFRRRA
jgi:uncharacterized protein (DUF934 family)